jgi:hypothetical protein
MQDDAQLLTDLVWSWAIMLDGFEIVDRETIIV